MIYLDPVIGRGIERVVCKGVWNTTLRESNVKWCTLPCVLIGYRVTPARKDILWAKVILYTSVSWTNEPAHISMIYFKVTRLGLVWYFPDMSGWTSGPIFSGEVRFFPDIDRGTSGGDFENYAEPKTQVFRCF